MPHLNRHAWLVRGIAVGATAVAATATGVAVAGSTHVRHPTEQPVVRVVHEYGHGPSASYSSDFGGIGTVKPVTFRVPTGAPSYSGTLTVSLDYRTTGAGTYLVQPILRKPDYGRRAPVRPTERIIPASQRWRSSTAVFRVGPLVAGQTYELSVGVNVQRARGVSKASIGSRHVLVDLLTTPRGRPLGRG